MPNARLTGRDIYKLCKAGAYQRQGGKCHVCLLPMDRAYYSVTFIGAEELENVAAVHVECLKKIKDQLQTVQEYSGPGRCVMNAGHKPKQRWQWLRLPAGKLQFCSRRCKADYIVELAKQVDITKLVESGQLQDGIADSDKLANDSASEN